MDTAYLSSTGLLLETLPVGWTKFCLHEVYTLEWEIENPQETMQSEVEWGLKSDIRDFCRVDSHPEVKAGRSRPRKALGEGGTPKKSSVLSSASFLSGLWTVVDVWREAWKSSKSTLGSVFIMICLDSKPSKDLRMGCVGRVQWDRHTTPSCLALLCLH